MEGEMESQGTLTNHAGNMALSQTGVFLQYAYLQGLDVLTTLAFLTAGVEEANPMVRALIGATGATLASLIGVKIAALGLGAFCWRTGRVATLRKANVFFSALVVWNLCCLILGLMARIKA
jgi:hypothetical protein